MSAVNVETRNAMASSTKRIVDYPAAYANHHQGLIKSASTSSCSAHENALLRTLRASRYATNGKKNGFAETGCPERLKLFVLQPFSHSEQNMLAAEADTLLAGFGGRKSFYTNAKHLADCAAPPNTNGRLEYSSHRNLDNLLVSRGNSAIMNFAAVNRSEWRNRETAPTAPKSSHEAKGDGSQPAPVPQITVSPSTPPAQLPKSMQAPVLALAPTASIAPAEPKDTDSSSSANSVASSKDCTPEPGAGAEPEPKEEKLCRRSSSLKMRTESTTNPAQKKIVRFADALGLDLTDVRTFMDELPSVPKSAYQDLRAASDLDVRSAGKLAAAPAALAKTLVPMFKQPGISHNFVERVRDQHVCLERAAVSAQPMCSIGGTVRVRNVDFHKSVYVRYTLDNWRTFGEVQAVYVADSCDGFSDQFSFVIYLYEVPSCQRVELAVRYHCSGSIYWDNNSGANYVFQTSSSPPTVPSYFACLPTSTDRCHSFY